jgi:hypothetical protein
MRLTRQQFVAAGAASALGLAGIYELVDRLAEAPERAATAGPLPPEQHLLRSQAVVTREGVQVLVPPLHHQVVTFELRAGERRGELQRARRELEAALRRVERRFPPTPAGLGITVGWGLPYFDRYVPDLARRHLPLDLRASRAAGREVGALVDAVRFPSDPEGTRLEANDAALLLRSDSSAHVRQASRELVEGLDLWRPTSIRRGFTGGAPGGGGPGLVKRMALAASVPGAELIPDGAQLFLGFTSTQRAAMGPSRIANLETLGLSDGGRDGYFRRGTAMHLSHLFEDVAGWYLTFDGGQRVATAFRPGVKVAPDVLTVPEDRRRVSTAADVERDLRRHGVVGHSAAIQTSSRLPEDVDGPDGVRYPKGTAVPQRADFNTLDNPFAWSADAAGDGLAEGARAGLHFISFNPTADDFHRNRLAMDGVLPDGTRLPIGRRSGGLGLNSVLFTTHRQNCLVPPRRHRSLPLVELLA